MALTIKTVAVQQTSPTLLVTVQYEITGAPAGETYTGTGAAIAAYLVAARRARTDDAVAAIRAVPPAEKTQAITDIQAP